MSKSFVGCQRPPALSCGLPVAGCLVPLGEALRKDAALVAATQLLDWEVRSMTINNVNFRYNVKMLEEALVDHGTMKPQAGFSKAQVVIRDTFDAFFGFLENARYAVEIDLFRLEDLFASPRHYYLGKVLEKNQWTHDAIRRFLEACGNEFVGSCDGKLVPERRKHSRKRCGS